MTLIEILVVVSIISILASIGLVNLLQAQARAKIARVANDQRVLASALEGYCTDWNAYPPARGIPPHTGYPFALPLSARLYPLTTPTSYVTQIPGDPFRPQKAWGAEDELLPKIDTVDYLDAQSFPERGGGLTSGGAWRMSSAGPDLYQAYGGRPVADIEANERGVDYDPTNGANSRGDIVRAGPVFTDADRLTDPMNLNRPGNLRVPVYLEQWR